MSSNDNEHQFVYFIENHLETDKINLSLKCSENENCFSPLQKIHQIFLKSENVEGLFEVSFYKFEVFLSNIKEKKFSKTYIKIKLEDKDKDKFESKINVQDIEKGKDYFKFNLQFVSSKKLFGLDMNLPPLSLTIEDHENFELYINLLRNVLHKDQNSKENKDLIYYTIQALMNKKSNYTYYFFSDILIETYLCEEYCLKLFDLYKKEKFDLKDIEIYRKRIDTIKVEIMKIIEIITTIFSYAKGNNKDIIKTNIVSFLFYFNYYYQIEQINNMVLNKEIRPYIYDILTKNKFDKLKLNKNSINLLIKTTNNFENANNIFSYNNNFLDLLEIINENNKTIQYLCINISNFNKKNKILKIKDFIKPQIDDDLNKIFTEIKKLIEYEKEEQLFFILFNDIIFNNYLELFSAEENFNKIIILYKISKYINENDNISKLQNTDKILNYIHNKGLDFIDKKKLTNDDLLDYLENDDYFTNTKSTNNEYEDQFYKVLQNIDLKTINNCFIDKWKKINWIRMHNNKKDTFYQRVCGSLKDIQYFGNLMNLLEGEKGYDEICLKNMLNTYKSLYSTYNAETCPNLDEQTSNLIYSCENKNIDSVSLIQNYILKIDDLAKKTFKNLISKENNKYSKNVTDIIIDYYNKNTKYFEKSDCSPLLYIINNSINLDYEIIKYLDNYSISKDDYFNLIENDNLKIYKALLDNNFLKENKLNDSMYYISVISYNYKLNQELKKGEIEYYYINNFYSVNKKDIFYERLLLISSNNKEIADINKKNIEENIKKIDDIMNDLNIIYNYLKSFYPKTQKDNIQKISKIKKDILDNNLLYYTKIETEYINIKKNFGKESYENSKFDKNKLFMKIYNEFKNINDDKEENNLIQTLNYIKMMKIIIEENTLQTNKINFNELQKIITLLKKEEKDIINDINLTISTYNFKKKVDIKKISEDLFLMTMKNKYILIIDAITNFIDLTSANKTFYYNVLKSLNNNLKSSNNINIIKFSETILNKYKIDLNEKYIDLLIKLDNKKEEEKFLFNKKNHTEYFFKKIKNVNKDMNNSFISIENCILFFKKFVNFNNEDKRKDCEIIFELKDSVNKKNEIYSDLENYFNKYRIFKDNFL